MEDETIKQFGPFAIKGLKYAAAYLLVSLAFLLAAIFTSGIWHEVLAALAVLFFVIAFWCGAFYSTFYRVSKIVERRSGGRHQ